MPYAHLRGVAAELLAEGDRGCVHQVGAAALTTSANSSRLGSSASPGARSAGRASTSPGSPRCGSRSGRRRSTTATRSRGRSDARGRRALAASDGDAPRWRSCCVEVPEPVWKTSSGNSSSWSPSATSRRPGRSRRRRSWLEHAQLGVGLGRRLLDQPEGRDQCRVDRHAGDREVLDGPLGLRLPQGLAGTRTSPIVSCSTR